MDWPFQNDDEVARVRRSAPCVGRVLIVDDDEPVRQILRRHLESAGFDVLTASSGGDGLGLLRADWTIRLVLLDLNMAGTNGWGFRRAQAGDERLTDIPTVILTGAPLPEISHAELGAADYLLKPVGRDHLLSVVEKYCAPKYATIPLRL